jgi:hypothetical protein
MAVGCGNCVGKQHSFVLLRNVVHIVTRCFKVLEAGDVTSSMQTVCFSNTRAAFGTPGRGVKNRWIYSVEIWGFRYQR